MDRPGSASSTTPVHGARNVLCTTSPTFTCGGVGGVGGGTFGSSRNGTTGFSFAQQSELIHISGWSRWRHSWHTVGSFQGPCSSSGAYGWHSSVNSGGSRPVANESSAGYG